MPDRNAHEPRPLFRSRDSDAIDSPAVIDPVLASYGLDEELAEAALPLCGEGRLLARVTNEDRLGYRLESARGELRGVLPGRLRRAGTRPAVGDWVIVEDRPGRPSGEALQVLDVVPRNSKLSRKAAGRDAVEQIVGANIDVAFLVTSIDGDLNARRIERYRAVCEDGGVRPVIVITKADLVEDRAPALELVARAAPGAPVILTSSVTGEGMRELDALLAPGLTVALLGSSGVGKSTLANRWIEEEQAVAEVDETGRGRHTTTSRSIFRARNGALLMDTPGMRELALWEADQGVRVTFPDVEAVAQKCRFRDCAHENEPGCALREAMESGALARDRVESWKKLRGELAEIDIRRDKRSKRTLSKAIRARLKDKGR